MGEKNNQKTKRKLGNVFYIGLLSFFGGISQDMFAPIFPLYLSLVLGFEKSLIGIAEGLVTAGASIFKIVAGFLTDKFGKRKPFIFLGYLFSLIARSLLALFNSLGFVFALRFLDGMGKGMKDSPKDALISDSTVFETRGKGFGVARALDTLGSVIGPLVLFGLLEIFSQNSQKYHLIFYLSALPLLITLLVLKFGVKEIKASEKENIIKDQKQDNLKEKFLPRKFYIFLAIMLLFGLGNSSDAFLILRASNVGVSVLAIPLVYALFNFIYASFSIPLGGLSDKIGREKVIMLGWFAYTISYLGFALAYKAYQIWIIFAFYGIYYATTEGVAKAFVADMVPSQKRGRAFGIYNTSLGLISLPSSFIAGWLWDKIGPQAPFFFGSFIAFLALIVFLIFYFLQLKNLDKN